jgi:hypothetical protein
MEDYIRLSDDCLIKKEHIIYFSSDTYSNFDLQGNTQYFVNVHISDGSKICIKSEVTEFEEDEDKRCIREKKLFDEVLANIKKDYNSKSSRVTI